MHSAQQCSVSRKNLSSDRRFFVSILLLMVLFVGGFAPPASAQTPQQIGEAARAAERIQQEQQERLRQQMLEDARKRKETAPLKMPEAPKPTLPEGGTCREIKEIVLNGVTLLSDEQQRGLLAPYLNRCLSASEIERLLGEIVKAYIDRGNISVRPYIRAQDLNSGRLEILVVEGRIESLRLQDGGKNSINLSTAFPGLSGQPLNLRDIEQGLDQINRLASNSATMEILPGTAPGDSIVSIANKPAHPLGFSLVADNLGSEITGRSQAGATLSVDNPLGINDYFSYTRKESFAADRHRRTSIMDSVYYSVPFGYALFSLAGSNSSYRTPVTFLSGTVLKSTGDSDSLTAKFDWLSYRDQVQKFSESIAITQKSSNNYIERQLLVGNSRKLAILDLDLMWNRFLSGGGMVNLGLGYSKGMSMLGALRDEPNRDKNSQRAQGQKFRYSASLSWPFKVAGYGASFTSQFSGQYALNALYGSEQMLIGSYYTVRGFSKHSLSGDRAYHLRNELNVSVPVREVTVKPYLALDGGRVQAYANTPAGGLVGFAAGFRISSKHVNGDIAYAQPLRVPRGMTREADQLLATLSLSF